LGDVVGGIPVSVGNDPALPADEQGLVDPVVLVDVMALGAFLAGVCRIDVHQRDACPACLVRDELSELVEGPGMERHRPTCTDPHQGRDVGRFVDAERLKPADVAADYLKSKGLTS